MSIIVLAEVKDFELNQIQTVKSIDDVKYFDNAIECTFDEFMIEMDIPVSCFYAVVDNVELDKINKKHPINKDF